MPHLRYEELIEILTARTRYVLEHERVRAIRSRGPWPKQFDNLHKHRMPIKNSDVIVAEINFLELCNVV